MRFANPNKSPAHRHLCNSRDNLPVGRYSVQHVSSTKLVFGNFKRNLVYLTPKHLNIFPVKPILATSKWSSMKLHRWIYAGFVLIVIGFIIAYAGIQFAAIPIICTGPTGGTVISTLSNGNITTSVIQPPPCPTSSPVTSPVFYLGLIMMFIGLVLVASGFRNK